MGDKSTARDTMKNAGVPTVPGSDGLLKVCCFLLLGPVLVIYLYYQVIPDLVFSMAVLGLFVMIRPYSVLGVSRGNIFQIEDSICLAL
jgi:biotin carboxylase